MTVAVEVSEMRSRLADILAKVEAGEEIVISRAERPVARLSPIEQTYDIGSLIDEIKVQREARHYTTQEEIHEWRKDGYRH